VKFEGFIGGSYESEASTADQEQTINWYPEVLESPGATAKRALYPTPGLTVLNNTAVTGKARAHWVRPCQTNTCMDSASHPERMPPRWTDGREFIIIGNTLYEVNSDDELIEYTAVSGGPDNAFTGSVNPSTSNEPATICGPGTVLFDCFITSHNHAYYFGSSSVYVNHIADLAGKATMGGYLDGYFLSLDSDNNTFYISNLGRADVWTTGTDFASRSLAPDPWRALKVFGRYVWLFGTETTELWQDTGERFPFAPIPSALINYGIAARWSAAIVDNGMTWLAKDPSGRLCVCRAEGLNIRVISTHALELAISGYSDFASAFAESYSDRGHTFYVLTFEDSNITWVWDSKTNLWHQRGTWNEVTGSWTSWRPRYHAFAFGEHRILDSGAGQAVGAGNPSSLYRMGSDLYEDIDGGAIRRVRRAPALMAENKRVFYSDFELDLEPGLGTSGQGEDPQVMMRMSDDGGKTWGIERMRSAGKTGEYGTRVRWNRLGAARRRVYEVSVSDPIPWRLTGAYLNANGS